MSPTQPPRPPYPGAPVPRQAAPRTAQPPKPTQRADTTEPPLGEGKPEPPFAEEPDYGEIMPNYQPTPNDPPKSIADAIPLEGAQPKMGTENDPARQPVVLAHDAGHDESRRVDGPGRPHLPNTVAFAPLQGVLSDPNDPNSVQAIVPPARPARTKP